MQGSPDTCDKADLAIYAAMLGHRPAVEPPTPSDRGVELRIKLDARVCLGGRRTPLGHAGVLTRSFGRLARVLTLLEGTRRRLLRAGPTRIAVGPREPIQAVRVNAKPIVTLGPEARRRVVRRSTHAA